MTKLIEGGKRHVLAPNDKELPVISIIIVTYNAATYLQSCIDSILKQKFKKWELMIFDGASTDSTVDILRANESHISYWQSEPDEGIYSAMNKAMKYPWGKWIYFLGSDDEVLDGFSEMANKLEDEDTIYYGHCLRKNIPTGGEVSPYGMAVFGVCHHALFYPAKVFTQYSFNTRYVVYADLAMNIELWVNKKFKKQYYPLAIANYHHEGFSTRTKDAAFQAEKLSLVKKHLGLIDYFRYLNRLRKERKKPESEFF